MADIMKMGANPNYLGSWDIDEVPNREITVTIAKIVDEKVVGDSGRQEPCTVAYFKEDYKPMILNITNKKRIVKLYKTKDTEKLIGKRITITTEPVKAFGGIHDALRIKQTVPPQVKQTAPKQIICSDCKKPVKDAFGKTAVEMAEITKAKYGRALCGDCAMKIASAGKQKSEQNDKAESTEQTDSTGNKE